MKPIKILISAATLMLVATTAYAQRSQGPMGGSSNSGGMGYGMDGGIGDMSLVVAADGTLITTSVTVDATTNTYKSSVVAVGPSGAVAWRWVAPNGVHRLELAGNIVLVSTGPMGYNTATTAFNPELTALSLSNGAVAWKLSLPGVAMAIGPAATMIYAVTMQPQPAQGTGSAGTGGMGGMGGGHQGPPNGGGTGTGMMNGTRTLVAISNSGVILWKLDLN